MRPVQGMRPENNHRPAMLSWLFVISLLALSTVLAVLQYRWIGEVSRADRERLHASLQAGLVRLSMDFNSEISTAASAIFRFNFDEPQAKPEDREKEYAARFLRWR